MKELPIDKSELQELGSQEFEKKYVHQVYDKIADHFSHTRYRSWPKVSEWLKHHSKPGDLVCDVGCGNGKYCTSVDPKALWLGTDYSLNLLKNARELTSPDAPESSKRLFLRDATEKANYLKPVEVYRADALCLPLANKAADLVICIAMLHHLTSRERRIIAIRELLRVSRRRVLIYVWAEKQTEGSIGARNFVEPEMLVAWKTPADLCYRYYKTFAEQEIKDEINEAIDDGCFRLEQIYYDSNNWAAELVCE